MVPDLVSILHYTVDCLTIVFEAPGDRLVRTDHRITEIQKKKQWMTQYDICHSSSGISPKQLCEGGEIESCSFCLFGLEGERC